MPEEILEQKTNEKPAQTWVYDAKATQKVKISENVFAVMKAYEDDLAQQFEDDLNCWLNANRDIDEADEKLQRAKAEEILRLDNSLFDSLCTTIEGETLPPNWKDEITAEDKSNIVSRLTYIKILKERKEFSVFAKTLKIPIRLIFNGKYVEVEIEIRKQTPADSANYKLIRTKRFKVVKKATQGKDAIIGFQSVRKEKSELFQEMFISQQGFKDSDISKLFQETIIDWVFSNQLNEVDEGK
jgi:hypothetical protein